FVAVVIQTLNRGNIHGRGQVVDDSVEHALNALVLESGAAQHGLDFAGDGTQAQALVDLGFGELACFQVLVHELFVGFSRRLNQFFTPFIGLVFKVSRDVDIFELGALAGFVPDNALHANQV